MRAGKNLGFDIGDHQAQLWVNLLNRMAPRPEETSRGPQRYEDYGKGRPSSMRESRRTSVSNIGSPGTSKNRL